MPKLSVVINTFNEAKNLPILLNSIKGLADEIVVCDMGSGDNTVDISKEYGAKIISHKRLNYVEPARNYAISKVTGDWVLVLDPDEEIGKKLASYIKKILNNPKADYYRIPRKNIIFGEWIRHSRWWPDYNIRLFKKGNVSWNEIIHAVPLTQGNGGEFEEKEELAIIHHNYNTIEGYLEHLNRYTSVQSELKVLEGYKFKWNDLLDKPLQEFFGRYFQGEGYKDGTHGLALSLLQSFSELVLYLKIWQNQKFNEENPGINDVLQQMKRKEREFHYWHADTLYKKYGKLSDRIVRKLRTYGQK